MKQSAWPAQPTLNEKQYLELEAQLGRLNGRFTRDPLSEYAGDTIHALMVTDPNYGTISFEARFPCCRIINPGPKARLSDEPGGNILHPRVLETEWMAAYGIGCMSGGVTVYLPQYPGGPQQFAQAVESVTRPKIIWQFVAMELVDSRPIRYGSNLQEPVGNNANPPFMVVHQSTLIAVRGKGAEAVFGTGQRINSSAAVLLNMYNFSDQVSVRVLQAETMPGWFRYRVALA